MVPCSPQTDKEHVTETAGTCPARELPRSGAPAGRALLLTPGHRPDRSPAAVLGWSPDRGRVPVAAVAPVCTPVALQQGTPWEVPVFQAELPGRALPARLAPHARVPLLDSTQVQCIKAYKAQEHDELTLEKADILAVKTRTSDGEGLRSPQHPARHGLAGIPPPPARLTRGRLCHAGWIEGIRLSDGERGWVPKGHMEEITSRSARLRNLRENDRLKHATRKLEQGQA